MTPLVGRESDIAGVLARLRVPGIRWVTLTGPGGVGKTRIAMAVADALLGELADRVRWIDLSAAAHPDEVIARIAEVVGVQESTTETSGPLTDRLAERLAAGPWLLVLDNLEHVIAAAAQITPVMRAAGGVQVLATSRLPVHVDGEQLVPVGPLPLEATRVGRGSPGRRVPPAIRLFEQRAQAVDPGFALTAATTPAVATICTRLDGLPLAIELAASQLKHWDLPRLLAELDDRLTTLAGGPRDVAPHHQSLRATFDRSWDLLSPEARLLLRRLSVLRGAFGLDLAAALSERPDAADLLAELERASVLQRTAGAGHSAWVMLETIRAHAWDHLMAAHEVDHVGDLLAEWCRALASRLGPLAFVREQDAAFETLEANRLHLAEALAWLDAGDEVSAYRALAADLRHFWFVRAHYDEGRRVLERALAMHPACSPLEAGRIQQGLAMLDLAQQLPVPALAGFLAADPLLRAGGATPREVAIGKLGASTAAFYVGEIERAALLQSEALATVADHDPECHTALAIASTANLAFLTGMQGDLAGAQALFDQVQAQQETSGVTWYLSIGWLQRGAIAELHGKLDDALAAYRASVGVSLHRHRDLRLVADAVAGVASVASKSGQMDQAARLLGAEAMLQVRIGGEVTYITSFMDRHHGTRQSVRTALGDQAYATLLRDGASMAEQELIEAIGLLDDAIAGDPPVAGRSAPYDLSDREYEVLKLLAAGRTTAEIAYQLRSGRADRRVSAKTVEKHITNIYRKLGVASRIEAAALAIRDGILDSDDD